MNHTPTPWKYQGEQDGDTKRVLYEIYTDGGRWAHPATCGAESDAKFIVKACNAHDDLVAALREIASGNHWVGACVDKANAALAKAAA